MTSQGTRNDDHHTPVAGDFLERLSRVFETLGAWSFDHRGIVIAVSVVLLAAGAWCSSHVRFDNSFQAWFDTDDPVYAAYLDFRDEFGSDEVSYIVYEAPASADGIWDSAVMEKVARIGERIEAEVPFVEEVTSPASAELVVAVPDGIDVVEIAEDLPMSRAEMLAARDRMLDKPLYVDALASGDGRYGAIVVEMTRSSIDSIEQVRLDPDGGDGLDNLYPQVPYDRIQTILADPDYADIAFHHTGDVALNAVMNRITARESLVLGAACFAVVGTILALFFRSMIGVLGPLVVVLASMMVAMAAIGVLGWDLGVMFSMMPALLIAVGVADSVHIISEYRTLRLQTGDARTALARTMYLVGTPCLLTSLTTAAGFGAMSVAPIKAIAEFGVYSAIGVLAAFALSITLLAVVLSFGGRGAPRDRSREHHLAKGGHAALRALDAVARFDLRWRRGILVVFALVLAVSGAGLLRLRVDSNFLNDFGQEIPVRGHTELADRVMGGSSGLVYVFDSGAAEGAKDPALLRSMDELARVARRHEVVRTTTSVADVVRDIGRTFNDNDPAFDRIPDQRDLVAQYLLLYEMSGGEEVDEMLSGDFSRATLTIRTAIVESSRMAELADDLRDHLDRNPPPGATVARTGIAALWIQLMDYITQSQLRGFFLAFAAITVMLCVLFRSVPIGLIAMVPNLFPVLVTVGGMGWAGVPLDYVRLLVAPVAIGIAVDDTIHHITRFRHEFLRLGSYEQALRSSMTDVGRALFITSVVLVLGFLTFTYSMMNSQQSFGALLATTIVTALVADFVLMPALVVTLKPFGPERVRAAGAATAPGQAPR